MYLGLDVPSAALSKLRAQIEHARDRRRKQEEESGPRERGTGAPGGRENK